MSEGKASWLQEYLKQLKKPSTDIYKINNLTSAFTNTYNNTRCPSCCTSPCKCNLQCARQNLRANGRTLLPCGRTLGRTPSTSSLEPGKPAIGFFSQAAVLPEVAEHVREAREDMTNGRT